MEIWLEAGTCEGDVSYALKAADAVAGAGADALKVQWFRPAALASRDAARYDKTGGVAKDQREVFGKTLEYHQWQPIVERCRQHGIKFVPSVFDLDAVMAAQSMGVRILKIASGDITHKGLIQAAAGAADKLVISTGASDMGEVEQAYHWVRKINGWLPIVLLACHLEYPTAHANAHLGRVRALQERFAPDIQMGLVEVGYSDHTPDLSTVIPLAMMEITVWEKHFSLLPYGEGGGDHTFAIRPEDVREAALRIGDLERMVGAYELEPSPGEAAARHGARRSLTAARAIKRGEPLTKDAVTVARPAGGIPPDMYDEVTMPGKEWVAMIDFEEGDPIGVTQAGRVGGTLTVE